MVISPKVPLDGWFKRCLVNGMKLSCRGPIEWILIYLGIPAISFYIPHMGISILGIGMSCLLGTFLCFKKDHLRDYSLTDFLTTFIVRPQPLFFLILVVVIAGIRAEPGEAFNSVEGFMIHQTLSFLYFFLGMFMAPFVLVVFYDLPRLIIWYHQEKNRKAEEQEINPPGFLGRFPLFGIHIAIDTNLDWDQICDYASKGATLLFMSGFRNMFLALLPISLTFSVPFLMSIFIPFYYCLYREIFWQQGITDNKTVYATADLKGK